jgi:hypothetical protein
MESGISPALPRHNDDHQYWLAQVAVVIAEAVISGQQSR